MPRCSGARRSDSKVSWLLGRGVYRAVTGVLHSLYAPSRVSRPSKTRLRVFAFRNAEGPTQNKVPICLLIELIASFLPHHKHPTTIATSNPITQIKVSTTPSPITYLVHRS